MKRLTAIITSYNRSDFVDRCIASIVAVAKSDLFVRVVIMDNGSVDDTPEVLARDIENAPANSVIETRRTEDNRHIVEVLNKGLAAAYEGESPDYIVVMNDDTQYLPGALEALIEACDAHPDSLMTPLQINYRAPEHVDVNALGHIQAVPELVEDAIMGRDLKQVYDLPTIIGACLFARRGVWERLGNFDPLFWFYGIDDDLCTRARFHGFRTLLVTRSHLYHAHGKLGVAPKESTPAARFQKWCNETQARFLFRFKNPEHHLPAATLDAFFCALDAAIGCVQLRKPKGFAYVWWIYLQMLMKLPAIAATRREHFRK
jgi:GT2 family glycosyltransferase